MSGSAARHDPPPVALQLFSVRDEIASAGYEATLRRVAEMGYVGVEPFGLDPQSATTVRTLCEELGLLVPCVHVPLPEGDKRDTVLDTVFALGAPSAICSLGRTEFTDLEAVERAGGRLAAAHTVFRGAGLRFGVHNHWWEYEPVKGKYPYRALASRLEPDAFFEIDVYWVQTAGLDPVAVLTELGARAPLLHVKDGPARQDFPMVAVGSGSLDIPAILAANAQHTEWLIVEIDRSATDMLAAVAASAAYIAQQGLGILRGGVRG